MAGVPIRQVASDLAAIRGTGSAGRQGVAAPNFDIGAVVFARGSATASKKEPGNSIPIDREYFLSVQVRPIRFR